jgi:hypothetical protein
VVLNDLIHRPGSRTAHIMDGFRRTPLAQQLMPQEASVMWPIPYRAHGRTYMILPIYLRVKQEQGGIVFPWSSTFAFEWRTGRLSEFVDCRFKSPWSSLDFSIPVGRSAEFTEETSQNGMKLASMYDELLDTWSEDGTLPPFWVAAFKDLLTALVEDVHRSFYQQLAPRFYERFLT